MSIHPDEARAFRPELGEACNSCEMPAALCMCSVPRVLIRDARGRLIDTWYCPSDEQAQQRAEKEAPRYPVGWTLEALNGGGARLVLGEGQVVREERAKRSTGRGF